MMDVQYADLKTLAVGDTAYFYYSDRWSSRALMKQGKVVRITKTGQIAVEVTNHLGNSMVYRFKPCGSRNDVIAADGATGHIVTKEYRDHFLNAHQPEYRMKRLQKALKEVAKWEPVAGNAAYRNDYMSDDELVRLSNGIEDLQSQITLIRNALAQKKKAENV